MKQRSHGQALGFQYTDHLTVPKPINSTETGATQCFSPIVLKIFQHLRIWASSILVAKHTKKAPRYYTGKMSSGFHGTKRSL